MPRIKRSVDKNKLQELINLAEKNGPFENRQLLWEKVATYPYAIENDVTPMVAYLRFREFELECKTPLGKRGKSKGAESTEPKPHKATEGTPEVNHSGLNHDETMRINTNDPSQPGKVKVQRDFFEPFTRRGLTVRCLEDLATSTAKSDAENIAIWEGWQEVIASQDGNVLNKQQLIDTYKREGKSIPESITRLIDRQLHTRIEPKPSFGSRVETVR